ncbi:TonB-dependent receptor domain-containing protein [Niabella drilacis]|uniref:Outer membrane receptor proteins, mostly Fe transport n=1 Tax=Niabella drilacis (strain DSM 25811 / CCM 8410 / CCUG 62505 / LMG 26954 / E90) TaxID=1285928 RepID=A0A1G6XFL7_NIADE|nr:TonB-dependent receptor [Niabella drilacis]SDD76852.1 Outer membrane receptor proteins, mostly Fe transport [Niabella drilacis]
MITIYKWLVAANAIKGAVFCAVFSMGIWCGCVKAQVQGLVQSESGDPVPYASINVMQKDGTGIMELMADSVGIFILAALADGSYQLTVSGSGYNKKQIPAFNVSRNTLTTSPLVVKLEANHQLEGVVVRSKRRIVEQGIDKMTLNVENSILSAGNTALELLERAPGVKVDAEGKISLKGKPGVSVMLNGKRTYLSASELAILLKATSASSVSKIEIISNPSARYDAAGNAGIINIVMKKNVQKGLNGTVTADAGAGRKARYGAGLNLNYRTEKFNIYGNYNYAFRGETEYLDFVRYFYENGRAGRTSVQRTETDEPLHTQQFSAGIDFAPDSMNSIGVLVNGNVGDYRHHSQTTNLLTAAEGLLSNAFTQNKDRQYWSSLIYNLNYARRFAKKGRELTLDLDVVPNRFRSDLTLDTYTQPNTDYPSGSLEQRRGNIPSQTDVYVAKGDYTDRINEKVKWELGVKSSFTQADNNLKYENRIADEWQQDATASNHFKYEEQIHAGYLNGIFERGKTSLQAGIRGELTKTTGNQLTTGQVFNRDYFQLFPSLALSQKINETHQLQAAYSRRIERPNYGLLNPFRLFRDPSLYYEGNPYLKPELTQHITLSHVLKNRYTTALNYSKTTDVITWVTGQQDATNTTYEHPLNLQALVNYGISVTAQLNYTSWWSATHFANLFRNEYQLPDSRNSMTSFSTTMQHTFMLGRGFSAECNGAYYSKAVYGILTEKAYYVLSAAFQKTVLKEKGSLKLAVNDLFQSQQFRNETRYQNINMSSKIWLDSRGAILSFTYRFGGQQTGAGRKTGSEDIQSRIR